MKRKPTHPQLNEVAENGDIICSNCEQWQSPESFPVNTRYRRGRLSWCKRCMYVYGAQEHMRKQHIAYTRWWHYGVPLAVIDAALEAQGGLCAVSGCGRPARDLDHDHACCPTQRACGQCARGMICHSCNRCLGEAKDGLDVLRARGHHKLAAWLAGDPRLLTPAGPLVAAP